MLITVSLPSHVQTHSKIANRCCFSTQYEVRDRLTRAYQLAEEAAKKPDRQTQTYDTKGGGAIVTVGDSFNEDIGI